ncbi:MAG: hypothetical protein ACQUHE_00200 [Bacteroidia bacterium]
MIDLKPVKLIHLFFCSGLTFFSAIAILLNKEKLHLTLSPFTSESKILGVTAVVIALIAVNLSKVIFNKMIAKINKDDTDEQKLKAYQTAFLVLAAILEAGSLFNIIVFFKTANLYFLIFGALCLLALVLNAPTKEKVYKLLQIKDKF